MIRQMTLRQIPEQVAKGLRARARKSGLSLNRATIALIEEALGMQGSQRKRRDLSRVAGQWTAAECAAFERNTRIFDKIDTELWKP